MIKIGIIGTGNTIGIAGMHINAYKLCPDAVITAVYDILPGRAQSYIDQYELKDAVVCKNEQEVFEKSKKKNVCAL